MKETAMSLWHYVGRGWAERAWRGWVNWAAHSRQEPMKKVVRMIREHLWGIVNAVVLRANNGGAESINSRIQLMKYKARGFRNKHRFINAIYFHLGGLDLYPTAAKIPITHTNG
jgi:transposase